MGEMHKLYVPGNCLLAVDCSCIENLGQLRETPQPVWNFCRHRIEQGYLPRHLVLTIGHRRLVPPKPW